MTGGVEGGGGREGVGKVWEETQTKLLAAVAGKNQKNVPLIVSESFDFIKIV